MSVECERAAVEVDALRTESSAYQRKVATHCLTNRRLELIILPTEQCNFRCVYCYEDFSIGRMSRATVEGVKGLIARRAPSLSELHLSFFGGEPLVAADLVEEIAQAACDAAAHRRELSYGASMTTNGALLTLERARTLQRVGVFNYQVSLDGLREGHDKTRLRANGGGTFGQIWSNLLAIRQSDLNVNILIRLHALRDNIDSLRALIELMREELSDARFSVLLKAVGRWGGPNDKELDVIADTHPDLEALRRAAREFIPAGEPSELPPVCYAARSNSLVIRANGRVGKCTVALRDPRNDIGQITEDGKLLVDADKLRPWLAGVDQMDAVALACPMSAMGWGGEAAKATSVAPANV